MFLALFGFVGLISFITSYYNHHQYEDVILKNKISITKKYAIKSVIPETTTAVYLLDNQTHFDTVKGYIRKLLKWYIIGENGFYVVNRLTRKIVSYQNYDLVPRKYQQKFKQIV